MLGKALSIITRVLF